MECHFQKIGDKENKTYVSKKYVCWSGHEEDMGVFTLISLNFFFFFFKMNR